MFFKRKYADMNWYEYLNRLPLFGFMYTIGKEERKNILPEINFMIHNSFIRISKAAYGCVVASGPVLSDNLRKIIILLITNVVWRHIRCIHLWWWSCVDLDTIIILIYVCNWCVLLLSKHASFEYSFLFLCESTASIRRFFFTLI